MALLLLSTGIALWGLGSFIRSLSKFLSDRSKTKLRRDEFMSRRYLP